MATKTNKLKGYELLDEIKSEGLPYLAAKVYLGGFAVIMIFISVMMLLTAVDASELLTSLVLSVISIGLMFSLWAWHKELDLFKEALFRI